MDYQRMIEDIHKESVVSDKIIHYEIDKLSGLAPHKQDDYDKDFQALKLELDSIQIKW